MSRFYELSKTLVSSMEAPGLFLPMAGIKLFSINEDLPTDISQYEPDRVTIIACRAIKATMLDDAVFLSTDSIGCVAVAISLGLISKDLAEPLEGKRVYTEIMRARIGKGADFVPPTPLDFTSGTVYACKDSGKKELGLFGDDDSGRYKTTQIARDFLSDMAARQPPCTTGMFCFSPQFDEVDLLPDVVIRSLRPVEMCQVIQGYQFGTGERIRADIGGIRAGCADLITGPYLTQTINVSPLCLCARLIAGFEGDRMGMGIPFDVFRLMVKGAAESMTGFPFPQYPGAVP